MAFKRGLSPLFLNLPSLLGRREILKGELEGRSPSQKLLPLPLVKGKGTKACLP